MRQIYILTIIIFFNFLNLDAQTSNVVTGQESSSSVLIKKKDGTTEGHKADNISESNSSALSLQNNLTAKKGINISPNPSTHFIQISGLNKIEQYRIYNILGKQVAKGLIAENETINIQNLKNGLYLLKINNVSSKKFLKE